MTELDGGGKRRKEIFIIKSVMPPTKGQSIKSHLNHISNENLICDENDDERATSRRQENERTNAIARYPIGIHIIRRLDLE